MVTIDVKGTIIPQEDAWIYDWLDYPYTTAKNINEQLATAGGQEVEVNINSGGGSVYDGSEIYTSLKNYKGNVTINVVGLAASAASIVAMSGNTIKMSPVSQMMIHNASMGAKGDYRDMNKASEILQSVNKSIANAYKTKTGLSDDELKQMMDNETWLTADEAKNLGLIDEIMFENDNGTSNIVFTNSLPMPSKKAIDELRKCGSIEAVKENLLKNKVQSIVNTVVDDKSTKKEAKIMDIGTLKNEHKDVYDQIVNEATKNERERIKSIEDLAIPGNEDIINKAKFETGATAEAVAVDIIKAQKEKGLSYIKNVKADAIDAKVNEVKEVPIDSKSKEENQKEAVNLIANAANKGR